MGSVLGQRNRQNEKTLAFFGCLQASTDPQPTSGNVAFQISLWESLVNKHKGHNTLQEFKR